MQGGGGFFFKKKQKVYVRVFFLIKEQVHAKGLFLFYLSKIESSCWAGVILFSF